MRSRNIGSCVGMSKPTKKRLRAFCDGHFAVRLLFPRERMRPCCRRRLANDFLRLSKRSISARPEMGTRGACAPQS